MRLGAADEGRAHWPWPGFLDTEKLMIYVMSNGAVRNGDRKGRGTRERRLQRVDERLEFLVQTPAQTGCVEGGGGLIVRPSLQ